MWMKSRIEQHIIGAVLSGREVPSPEGEHLRPRDLEHPLAGNLLHDIQEVRQIFPGATATEVIEQIADRYTGVGVTPSSMRAWCALPISDRELAGGMRLFLHLGADQEIWELADAVKQSLTWKDSEGMTRVYQRDLNAAITRRFETVAFAAVTPDADRRQLFSRYETADPLPGQAPAPHRLDMEEEILAHLLEKPGLCWASANLISESTFASAHHRDLFWSISWVDRHEPQTEDRGSATLDELARQRSYRPTRAENTYADDIAILDRLYGRLTESHASPGKALALGRDLLAEDLVRKIETSGRSQEVSCTADEEMALQIPQASQPQQEQPRW